MIDFLTALIRREQGLPPASGVAPRLPISFEGVPLSQIDETTAPSSSTRPQSPPQQQAEMASPTPRTEASLRPEAAPRPEHSTTPAVKKATPVIGPAPIVRDPLGEIGSYGHPVAARAAGQSAPALTQRDKVATARAGTPTPPVPTVTRLRSSTESRLSLVEPLETRTVDVPAAESQRSRDALVGDAVLPRPDIFSALPATNELPPAPIIRVSIGRVEVRAVAAESPTPVPVPATGSSAKPRTLDEYLEERNARRGR